MTRQCNRVRADPVERDLLGGEAAAMRTERSRSSQHDPPELGSSGSLGHRTSPCVSSATGGARPRSRPFGSHRVRRPDRSGLPPPQGGAQSSSPGVGRSEVHPRRLEGRLEPETFGERDGVRAGMRRVERDRTGEERRGILETGIPTLPRPPSRAPSRAHRDPAREPRHPRTRRQIASCILSFEEACQTCCSVVDASPRSR